MHKRDLETTDVTPIANEGAPEDVTQLVVLVPGFLGFSRFGGFYYFADRVAAALRASLEQRLSDRIPVIPVETMPTGSLASRQAYLLEELNRLAQRFPRLARIHLVGHSTGGLDAQLLLEDAPFRRHGEARAHWDPAAESIRERLASVVTIGSPLWGTCLADSEVAAFIESPARHLRTLPRTTALAGELLAGVVRGPLGFELAAGVSQALPDAIRFLRQVARHRELIEDLKPSRLLHHRQKERRLKVSLRSFVTVARDPSAVPTAESDRQLAEPFFASLYELTARTQSSIAGEQIDSALPLLASHASKAIRASGASAPIFSLRANDGVVNSGLQLLNPTSAEELAGIVVADHADVIGHYDRMDSLISGRTLNRGLFHSGCAFGDDAFFHLWESVAKIIAAERGGQKPLRAVGS